MLKISLDEAYVFDLLSINNVKVNNTNGAIKQKNILNYEKLAAEIKAQIGEFLFHKIIDSDEFKELYNTNYLIFNAIDDLTVEDIAAANIDTLNHKRFLLKNNLQEKFFGGRISEVKVGY